MSNGDKGKDLSKLGIQLPSGAKLGETYLQLPPGMSSADWADIAHRVTQIGQGYWWWVGDLAYYAQHQLEDPEKRLQELYDATGAGDKYVKMVAHAAKKFAVKDRVAGLSITHHLRVMHLPPGERQKLLLRAKERAWSTTKLGEAANPPDRQRVTLIIHVRKNNETKKCVEDLAKICEGYKAQIFVKGQLRPGATKMRRGKGAVQLR